MIDRRMIKLMRYITMIVGWYLISLTSVFAQESINKETILQEPKIQETKIWVRLSSNVIHNDIRLGDIAEIQTASWEQTKRLGDIVVASAPEFGQRRTLSSNDIQDILNRNNLDLSRIVFESPKSITISRHLKRVLKNDLEALIGEAIQRSEWWDRKNSQLRKIQISSDIFLPPGEIVCRIGNPNQGGLGNPMLIPVTIMVDDQFRKKITAYAYKNEFTDVVVVSKMLRRYQVITADDITLKRINTTQLSSTVITKTEEAVGKRTRRAVYPKTVLRTDLVEMPPIIKRKDIVTIMAVSRNLRVTAIGEAQERGRQGERISVVNIDSGEKIYALVIDPKTVKIEF